MQNDHSRSKHGVLKPCICSLPKSGDNLIMSAVWQTASNLLTFYFSILQIYFHFNPNNFFNTLHH